MRTVLITGATSGFGALMVRHFLENGDFVIATGRKLSERQTIFHDLRDVYHDRLIELDLDICSQEQIQYVTEFVSKKFQRLDVLINNAGYGLFGALEDLSEVEIRQQMEVNFFGPAYLIKAFIPLLRLSEGKIFNVSSVLGLMGLPLTGLYCASKYALEGLTESLRFELAAFNIQLCLIGPGGYGTKFSKNLNWVISEDSLYKTQLENYQKLRAKVAANRRQKPEEVSLGILRLSLMKKIPMRKVFGQDARLSSFLKKYLPQKCYFYLMDKFCEKYFHKKGTAI